MSSGYTVTYTLPHSGFSKDVYWSADFDEARAYAQMVVQNQGHQMDVQLSDEVGVVERWPKA